MLSVHKMMSEKGKDLIVVNNFKFRFHKSLAHGIKRWSCVEKKCKSFIKTDEFDCVLEFPKEHDHGLSFLPPTEVEDFFTDDLIPIMPNNDKIEKFCDYVLENYILPDSKFPPEMWAEYTATTTLCQFSHPCSSSQHI
uniref:FLYWCH-type domain-containing protein n=1 Tax=Cacopsylla melanoneura TaxID=428564 RepID=A0A8D8VV18_9HEMI